MARTPNQTNQRGQRLTRDGEPDRRGQSPGSRRQRFGEPTRTGDFNRKGPPKKKRGPRTMADELAEMVEITEGGKKRKITKQEAVIKGTVNDAMRGDAKARREVFNYLRSLAPEDRGGAAGGLISSSVMDEMLARHEQEIRDAGDCGNDDGGDTDGGKWRREGPHAEEEKAPTPSKGRHGQGRGEGKSKETDEEEGA